MKKLIPILLAFALIFTLSGCALHYQGWSMEPGKIDFVSETVPVTYHFMFSGSPGEDVSAALNLDDGSYPLRQTDGTAFSAVLDRPLCRDYTIESVTVTQNGHDKTYPIGTEWNHVYDCFARVMLTSGAGQWSSAEISATEDPALPQQYLLGGTPTIAYPVESAVQIVRAEWVVSENGREILREPMTGPVLVEQDGETLFEDVNTFTYPLEEIKKAVPAGYHAEYSVEAVDQNGALYRADYYTVAVAADGNSAEQGGIFAEDSSVLAVYKPDGTFLSELQ